MMRFFPKVWYGLAFSLVFSPMLTSCKPNPKPTDTSSTANSKDGVWQNTVQTNSPTLPHQGDITYPADCNNQAIYQAFSQKNENRKIQVIGCGQVKKVLPDDNDGTRHQKFLLTIDGYPQISVLVAHNIDLAKRVDNIQPNTPMRFYGEYIYNAKGGVIHWTHKDPAARHQDGWLEYHGQKYW